MMVNPWPSTALSIEAAKLLHTLSENFFGPDNS
jgi:hypothetical protein